MMQVTRTDVVVPGADRIGALREQFDRHQCVVLRDFLDDALLRYVDERLRATRFVTNVPRYATGEPLARELCAGEEEPLAAFFPLLLNRKKLFQVIQQITGCPTIGSFRGRLFRREPGGEHHDSWHDDVGDHRLVGMSMNLTATAYTGGGFQLRDHRTERVLCDLPPTSWGDAHIFRIAPDLQHRVMPVEGRVARTAYAGWFCSEPHHDALLRDIFHRRPHPGVAPPAGADPLEPTLGPGQRPPRPSDAGGSADDG